MEIEKAFALFDKYNYAGAREKLKELKESVPTPEIRQQLSFVYHLALTYERWDALDFPGAYETICILTKELTRDARMNRYFLMMDFLPVLKKQEAILEKLNALSGLLKEKRNMEILTRQDLIIPLMFTMYVNAGIREKQEKYDMATLLLYRLLEMIEQRRLSVYNLYVSQMNYETITYNMERLPQMAALGENERIKWLREQVVLIKKELFRGKVNAFLPEQISLLEGFILLLALNDEISEVRNGHPTDKLKRIRSMVFLRNNSIFAHGLGPVVKEDFNKFRDFVTNMFQNFCQVEAVDFECNMRDIQWLNPVYSDNYARMESFRV